MTEQEILEQVLAEDDILAGFDAEEARNVIMYYACPVCYNRLNAITIPGMTPLRYVCVCLEHGNVERIGRITANTVAILQSQATFRFWDAVRNLPDLWGELTPRLPEELLSELGF